MTDTLKLKEKLFECGMTNEQLASILEITVTMLNRKINNQTEFKASEIQKLSVALKLSAADVNAIFFC